MASPEATFDALFVVRELSRITDGASANEVALFSYLACLLWVYRGNNTGAWNYSFTATQDAAPYSEELSSALQLLARSGLIRDTRDGYIPNSRGDADLHQLMSLTRFEPRTEYLEAATGSALAIPLPLVGSSLSAEPQLRRALKLSSTRPLLNVAGREALHTHFEALSQAVPESDDLLAPAVVWLSYLSTTLDEGRDV